MVVRTLLIHQSCTYACREAPEALAADPGEDVLVDLAGSLHVQEVARVLDHDHPRGGGEEAFGATRQLRADAAVVGPVQVEGGLRRLPPGRLFLRRIPDGALSRAADRPG